MFLRMSGKKKHAPPEGQPVASGACQGAERVALCAPFTLGSWMKTHLVHFISRQGGGRKLSSCSRDSGRSLSTIIARGRIQGETNERAGTHTDRR